MIHLSQRGSHKRYAQITANYFHTQEGRFYNYLLDGWKTASQAERDLGLRISNLTIYKRKLEKSKRLWVGKEVRCPITNRLANLITTNRELAERDFPHLFNPVQASFF